MTVRKDLFSRPLYCAHEWVRRIVRAGDAVIDATAGNGYDSFFLANLVGSEGRVDVFDIQPQALESTRQRLEEGGCMDGRARLHLMSHARMAEATPESVRAVMFNLGYLPGGDKSVISQTGETLKALEVSLGLLSAGGIVTVVCYPGHEGGDEEAREVERFFSALPSGEWTVSEVKSLNGNPKSPFLIAAVRL